MLERLQTLLQDTILPALYELQPGNLVLPGDAAKKSFGAMEKSALKPPSEVGFAYSSHEKTRELVFCASGAAEMLMDGRRYELKAGDFSLIISGVMHAERILSEKTPYSLIWFRLTGQRIAVHESNYNGGSRLTMIKLGRISDAERIIDLVEGAEREFLERKRAWFEMLRAQLCEAMILAARSFEERGSLQSTEDHRESMVDSTRHFIQQFFAQQLTLEKIAKQVYVSPNYLGTLFKTATGKTVFEYVEEVRLEEAKRLLAETDHSVREVGRRSGFPTPAYFNRLFKTRAKQTPLEYRRQIQAASVNERSGVGRA